MVDRIYAVYIQTRGVVVGFDVGDRLKRLRQYYKLTQFQMADKASIDYKYYGRLERNESVPTIATVEKICSGLDISLAQFFMPTSKTLKADVNGEFHVQKIQAKNMIDEIDIHFYRDAIIKDCNNCLWYSGYLASAYLDEFELKLSVEGNVRAQIYVNYEEVASINDESAGSDLLKYIKNDAELTSMLVREEFSDEILSEHNGTVVFVPESNWLTLTLIDHRTEEIIDVFELDTDNIFEPFMSNDTNLADYIFS